MGQSALDSSIRWFMHLTPNPEPAHLSSRRSPVCEAKTAAEWTDPFLASCLCGFVLGHQPAGGSWQEGRLWIGTRRLVFTPWLYLPKMSDLFGIIPTLPATPPPPLAAIDYLLRYKKCSKFRPVDEYSSAGCESGQDDL